MLIHVGLSHNITERSGPLETLSDLESKGHKFDLKLIKHK
jgi:hypothetical protein